MGTVNRITRDLKAGIVDAAAAHGSDGQGTGGLTGYLFWLAGSHPKAFSGLLAKLLPLQVNGNVNTTVGTVNIVSVPVDRYLSAADMAKVATPQTIEHAPQEPPRQDDAA
ncbi:hypothetical protein [Bradyrhizobium neotropicale]|uniref:hypothetical protein n=1 Tax=Bradyrhizobium neotropicale TaxID=1497615 RepID=UPI001AD78B78|nr:hypothetical protein [Bradyrhizobium neotropicale]MBO4228139.1 hypothetical protein [Bradyrhizobium neotropicale]